MRNLTPFFNARVKDSFAHVPQGMDLLEIKLEGRKDPMLGWFLKMGEVLDLNALCHEPRLIEEGVIPSDDAILPTTLALRGLLFLQKAGNKRTYFQAPLPTISPFGRSTEQNDDAEFLYGLNISSAIGAAHAPDAYYQLSLVFDTRTGLITSGSKVRLAKKDVAGELSIIGYLLSGKLDIPEIKEEQPNAVALWSEDAERFVRAPHGEDSSALREVVLDEVHRRSPIPESVDLRDQLPSAQDQGDLARTNTAVIDEFYQRIRPSAESLRKVYGFDDPHDPESSEISSS